jgi:glucose-6-phosphate 1-epimerase
MGMRTDNQDPRNDDKAYGGGAPHCFPQFGDLGKLPQHGFLRTTKFIQEERAKKLSFDRMIYKVVDTEETLKIFPYKFEYRFDITLRDDSLEWEVIVINLDSKPFDITTGLHNYFDVSSLKNIVISGNFQGAKTLDRITGKQGVGASNDIRISEATDTLYYGVKGPITITDSGKKTKVTLTRKGFQDTVIWSPYGNTQMGFDKFICVEPVQATPVEIPVGQFKETHVSSYLLLYDT